MLRRNGWREGGVSRFMWLAALVLWIAFIWGHSLMPGVRSTAESSSAVSFLRPLLDALGIVDEGLATHVVRKSAHFTEFAVLGVLAVGTMRAWFAGSRRMWGLVALVWLVVPCVDETIQRFVPERDGKFSDVLIDLCGCALGILISWLVCRWLDRRSQRAEK
ncbi:MAG: VanZ family protein [Coriobacteriales bacterium]|nr:VanZ family protein [Coriobacteriales bacterium]